MKDDHCSWNEADGAALAELLLRHSQQHGVIFFDPGGRVRGWGHGAYAITGFTVADVIGQPNSMLFTPEDRARGLDRHELDTARAVGTAEDERWHLRRDGSRFWSSGITIPMRAQGDEVTGFVKIFRDGTHLRARMKYLENVLQEDRVARARQEIFLGTIAHELRNPLAPLKTALQLIRAQSGDGGRHDPSFRIMDRQLGFLERLVEDLVDLARVKAGKMSIVYQRVELQRVLQDALDSCRGPAESRGVGLQAVLPPVSLEIDVDPERLHQVIINLLTNAIKFTPAGGQVWLTSTADRTHFLVFVRDTGCGIGPDLLPKIFDMFTQAPGAESRRGAGLGIGLALVKQVVSLHAGTVEVRSGGEGKGSEFIVRIPLQRPRGSEPEGATSSRDGA